METSCSTHHIHSLDVSHWCVSPSRKELYSQWMASQLSTVNIKSAHLLHVLQCDCLAAHGVRLPPLRVPPVTCHNAYFLRETCIDRECTAFIMHYSQMIPCWAPWHLCPDACLIMNRSTTHPYASDSEYFMASWWEDSPCTDTMPVS